MAIREKRTKSTYTHTHIYAHKYCTTHISRDRKIFTYQLIRSIVQITFESGPKSSNQKLLEPHLHTKTARKKRKMMMMVPDQSTIFIYIRMRVLNEYIHRTLRKVLDRAEKRGHRCGVLCTISSFLVCKMAKIV